MEVKVCVMRVSCRYREEQLKERATINSSDKVINSNPIQSLQVYRKEYVSVKHLISELVGLVIFMDEKFVHPRCQKRGAGNTFETETCWTGN